VTPSREARFEIAGLGRVKGGIEFSKNGQQDRPVNEKGAFKRPFERGLGQKSQDQTTDLRP